MRSLFDVSIRTKLLVLLVGVVVLALAVDFGVSTYTNAGRIKDAMAEHHAVLADVLGANSKVALSFDAPTQAEEVLSSLHLEPAVLFACTYDARGEVFAIYRAKQSPDIAAPPVRTQGTYFTADGNLEVFKTITQENKAIGTIYLRVSMERLSTQVRSHLLTAISVLIIALTGALLLGWRLQHLITQPIFQLAHAMKAVSTTSDYTQRVPKDANDELGQLCDGFNAMLAQIQQRDSELDQHRLHLEKLVQDRTRTLESKTQELAASNETLQAEIAQRQVVEQELTRSNQELEQFAYIASHDLQEPLRKVQAFGDLLAAKIGPGLGDEERDYLKRMQAAALRMQGLINDLLTFARVTSQARPFVPVDLARIASEVMSDLETRVKTTAGRVELGALPRLEGDAVQLRQLLQNLIGNALKFHRKDVPPVIQVAARVLKNREGATLPRAGAESICEITVADNGIGFDEKYLDRIFRPFQRLHGRGEYEGTGMGLAICRKIVERHGGTLTARSTPGQGATFIVLLPLCQPKKDEHHA